MSSPLDDLVSSDGRSYRPSAIRALAHLINDPRVISFAGGLPSPATFPAEAIGEAAAEVIRTRSNVALQYGPTPGLPRLRDTIAGIGRERGITCGAEHVLVTTGSQQALHLLATALIDPGDVVLVELPSYVGGLAAFLGRRAAFEGVPQDEDGLIPEALEATLARLRGTGRRVKALYTIPNFQNPSGRLLSQPRRDAVVEIAKREGFVILEDDPYGELKFDETAETRPMAARPGALAHVVYLGSFSKILAPGLRCGFIIADPALHRRAELVKEAADLCSGMLDQSIVDEFCARGALPGQIRNVRAFYRDRSRVLMESLQQHMATLGTWTEARGGLFTWLTLEPGIDTKELLQRGVEEGVVWVPGGAFFVDGSGANTMRLTFAKEPDDRMRDGVVRLARLFS